MPHPNDLEQTVPGPAGGEQPLVDLTGKVAVLTGAGGGLGSSEARLFARLGAKLMLTDVREEAVRSLADELGEQAAFAVLDVRDEEAWAGAMERTLGIFERVDALVNNAGIYVAGGTSDLDPSAAKRVIDTNLVGAILGVHAATRSLRRPGGSVVLISSVAGVQGHSQAVAYSASKWGLRGVCRSAAVELGPLGIRVNCICPGGIDTEMARDAERQHAARDAQLGTASQPIARLAEPSEIAAMAAFLVSDAASYCTGGDFIVDGGAAAGL
jgi:3alpha(or 20beta)-hydroxysteroid dehydrogenase